MFWSTVQYSTVNKMMNYMCVHIVLYSVHHRGKITKNKLQLLQIFLLLIVSVFFNMGD